MIRIPLSDFDRIEYLTCRKFPLYRQITLQPSSRVWTGTSGQKHIKDIETYQSELRAKPPEELQTLYEQEQEKEQHELQAEEQQRFFNLPNAKADFTHWSKAAYWTLDEGIALLSKKAPEVVKWERVKEFVHISPFAIRYGRVRDLALRAKACGQLSDPELPGVFLAWARRTEIDIPSELVEQVEARGVVIADWKDMFDKLNAEYDKYVAAAQTRSAANDKIIAKLSQECDAMRLNARQLESKITGLQEAAWEFDTDSDTYPPELDIALQAWRAATQQRDSSKTAKEQIREWLKAYYPKLSEEAKERIAVLCNWERAGGKPRRGGNLPTY